MPEAVEKGTWLMKHCILRHKQGVKALALGIVSPYEKNGVEKEVNNQIYDMTYIIAWCTG